MYEFLAGPVLWASLIIFVSGLALRMAALYVLSRKRDRVLYNHASASWAARSTLHWLTPWASASMRRQPLFTLTYFVFHVCLFAVPLFLLAHNMLLYEALGIRLWSMPERWADALTLVFLVSALILAARRILRPEVRILTTPGDYALLVLTVLPFLTGFLAYHQWTDYRAMMILHVLTAEILLVAIPFTKLAHMLLFFFSRAFIGFEMGARRGARSW